MVSRAVQFRFTLVLTNEEEDKVIAQRSGETSVPMATADAGPAKETAAKVVVTAEDKGGVEEDKDVEEDFVADAYRKNPMQHRTTTFDATLRIYIYIYIYIYIRMLQTPGFLRMVSLF